MADCTDPNIPTVDNEACECQDGIHSFECINASEANNYFNYSAGTNLTRVFERVAAKVKSNANKSNKNARSYKTIELLLTQSGVDAPTSIELIKETLATISLSYVSSGNYIINSSNTFVGDISIYIGTFDKNYGEDVKASKIDDSNISIRTGVDNNYDTDGVLNATPITIKIPT